MNDDIEELITRFPADQHDQLRREMRERQSVPHAGEHADTFERYLRRLDLSQVITASSFEELPRQVTRKCCPYKSCGNTDLYLSDTDIYTHVEGDLYRKGKAYGYRRASNDEWYGSPSDDLVELLTRLNHFERLPVTD